MVHIHSWGPCSRMHKAHHQSSKSVWVFFPLPRFSGESWSGGTFNPTAGRVQYIDFWKTLFWSFCAKANTSGEWSSQHFPLYWHCSKISSTLACTSSYGTYSSLALGCLRVHAAAFALGLDFAFALTLTGALASWVWTALTAVPAENSWSGVFCRSRFLLSTVASGWACVDSLSLPCFQALATLWVFTDREDTPVKVARFPRETVVLLVLLEPWLWFFWLDLPLALLAPFPFSLCFVSLTLFFLLDPFFVFVLFASSFVFFLLSLSCFSWFLTWNWSRRVSASWAGTSGTSA